MSCTLIKERGRDMNPKFATTYLSIYCKYKDKNEINKEDKINLVILVLVTNVISAKHVHSCLVFIVKTHIHQTMTEKIHCLAQFQSHHVHHLDLDQDIRQFHKLYVHFQKP